MHNAWNALEDQRMETAVVSDSPRKAGYFTPMMLSELASTPAKAAANWPLMVWRKYLPKHVRDGAKAMFMSQIAADAVSTGSGLNPADIVRSIQTSTTKYVLAQTATAMFDAVMEMADVLTKIRLDFDISDAGHGRQRSKGTPQPDDLDIPVDPTMIDEDEDEQTGPTSPTPTPGNDQSKSAPKDAEDDKPVDGGGASKDDDDTETDDDDDDDEAAGDDEAEDSDADDDGASAENVGGTEGTHEDDGAGYQPPLSQDDLNEALAEAEDQRMQDATLDADVQAFKDAERDVASTLPLYQGGVNSDPEDTMVASALAQDLERSFQTATANVSPMWHEQQRRGVINVNRYSTRRPGDVEFFRAYVDEGEPGTDIAVSVLLDYSGSMWGVTKELAQVAYAAKAACDRLGIPCTVVLWDTEARTLWDASERAEVLPTIEATGGTDPRMALNDLDNQTFGRSKHLVLVMTDDAWSSNSPMLTSYRDEGRVIIGLGYTGGGFNPAIQQSLERKGADFAYSIDKLTDIPKHLEQALVSLV